MQKPKLYIDAKCEVAELLRPYADQTFRGLDTVPHTSGDIYVLSRVEFRENLSRLENLISQGLKFVYSNPFEGSETLAGQLGRLHLSDLFYNKKMLVVGGGDMALEWPNIRYDLFVTKPHNFQENLDAIKRSNEIFEKVNKPYSFLLLNGRGRDHRKYLIERLEALGLLEQSLYSWLDTSPIRSRVFDFDFVPKPRAHKFLPAQYEYRSYQANTDKSSEEAYAKHFLFNNEWGEIYLNPDTYIDTYFSVITETVHNYPHSFRTEKIWKPIAIGHPWVCVANTGYYRDLRNLGFRTFDSVIDESFDGIENNVDRLNRVIAVIEDICKNGLAEFLASCQDICKYNQDHMLYLRDKVNRDFPDRFFQFLKDHQWMT